jgi:3-hydroxyacyl-[acyl-carrier-protein] dehydratase
MQGVLNVHDILKLLPHRYPFLLIDKVIDITLGKSLIALKNVCINEHFFVGHFPGQPVMPGVLILEAMAQAAGVLAYQSTHTSSHDHILYFAGVDKARFRRVVEPGDQLLIHVNVLRTKEKFWKLEGFAYVDDELACSAEFLCARK